MTDLTARLDLAVAAAQRAGEATLRWFQHPDLRVDTKGDGSPVTRADREAEEVLRGEIEAAFPDDAILGEEFGSVDGTSGFRWILDPIDGTQSFAHGVPLYCTLVGIEHAGEAVAGVIHMPALGETVHAVRGGGAHWRPGPGQALRSARVTATARLDLGLFCTTGVSIFDEIDAAETYTRLRRAARVTRGWSDGYGHLLVATGRIDVMVDPVMSIWDCAALLPVIEEAGGRFTDLTGRRTHDGGSAVATNGALHDEVLAVIRGEGRGTG